MERFEQLSDSLRQLTSQSARDNLLAKGLSRGLIWNQGILPDGAPNYGPLLTGNLLDYGYSILTKAIHLLTSGKETILAKESMRYAAECIESAVRRGPSETLNGFNLLVSASAFHIAGYAARSYCLLEGDIGTQNLSSIERFFKLLLRKELGELRIRSYEFLRVEASQDAGLSEVLSTPDSQRSMDIVDVLIVALSRNYVTAVAGFDYALRFGDKSEFTSSLALLSSGLESCNLAAHVPQWWIHKLTILVMEDLWQNTLHECLPDPQGDPNWSTIRRKFISVQASRNLSEVGLWPSQIQAALRTFDETDDLVVSLPTSAGKTKIAELCILRSLSLGKRAIYVTPLRALSAQIERRLARSFRPLNFSVSSLYGASGVAGMDISTLKKDHVVVATPEKLDFALRQDPSVLDDVGVVVLDEGHMIGLGNREIRYEVLVQRLLRRTDSEYRRIVCLSAIFSSGESFRDFTEWLRSDAAGTAVHSSWQPTRRRVATLRWFERSGKLDFYQDADFDEAFIPRFLTQSTPSRGLRKLPFPQDQAELTIKTTFRLVESGHKVLVYCPQKRYVESLGRLIVKLYKQHLIPDLLTNRQAISKAEIIGHEWLGENHIALQCLRLGIGIHHGSLPRPFLAEVEQLLDMKALPIVIASPTMAQGVDLTCSAIVFHSIYSFGDRVMSNVDYANVIGRVGRAFVDIDGLVVFPLFRPKITKLRQLDRLVTSVDKRDMESGLVQLIESLIFRLQRHFNFDSAEFIDYILNSHQFSWRVDEETEEEETPFSELLDSFDNAILSTIEDLDTDVHNLAALLDQALHQSLWERRAGRKGDEFLSRQRAMLIARSNWIWTNSSGSQRRGFFSAGIGFQAGQVIDQNLNALVSLLLAADNALATGDIELYSTSLQAFADIVLEQYPFSRSNRTAKWKSVLQFWLTGASLAPLNGETDLIACIQEDFVYRLVWALEAVRTYAREQGLLQLDSLSGNLPLTVMYGVPSKAAATLQKVGLPSRLTAQKLLLLYPAPQLESFFDVHQWISQIEVNPFASEDSEFRLFEDFVSEFRDKDFFESREKTWRLTLSGLSGSKVNFVPDGENTILVSSTMDFLGRFKLDVRNLAIFEVQQNIEDELIVRSLRI